MQNGFVLKAKTAIKKIAAISAGVLMTGATMFGAVSAVTLADYPAPFITSGKWVGLIVVGSDAAAGDIVGATDIAATLAQGATISSGGSGGTTVSGGKSEDLLLNTSFNASGEFGNALTDDDLAGLQDSTLSLDIGTVSGDYDYHDELVLGGGYNATFGVVPTPLRVDTSLTSTSPDEDWKADIFTLVPANAVEYYYIFDEDITSGNRIINASTADPITINFLGKNIEISSADKDTITAQVGEEAFLNVDDSVVVNGKTVKLLNVASGTSPTSVVVDVDGVQSTVTGTEKVNGLKVKVKETFYSDTRTERSASLIVGTDATKSYDDGDEYIGQSEDDPDWVWDLENLDGARPVIGIKFAQNLDDPTDGALTLGGTVKSTAAPTAVLGDTLSFPNNYIKIKLDSTIENDYRRYTVDTTTEELWNAGHTTTESSSAKVLHIHAGDGSKSGFLTSTGVETDDLYLWLNATALTPAVNASYNLRAYYKNHDAANKNEFYSEVKNATSTVIGTLEFQDSSVGINVTMAAINWVGNMTFQFYPTGREGDARMYFERDSAVTGFDYLGHSDSDTTYGSDLVYLTGEVATATRDLSGWEDDTRTESGVVIKDPKAHLSGDSFDFDVSGDDNDFKVRVIISGPGTTVTTAKGGSVVVQPVSGVPVAKLDTEVADKTAYNMILVGGPAVNRLTAEAIGLTYPTRGATALTALGIGANEATLKLVDKAFSGSKVALLVVGYEAADTRNAASVLKDYSSYSAKLTGSQVIVKSSGGVISVSAPTVAAA